MSDIRQNLLQKTEETANINDSFFYVLKKSGSTWLDRRISSSNLIKFLLNIFFSSSSELSYTGNEKLIGIETAMQGHLTLSKINSFNFFKVEFDNSDLVDFSLNVPHGKGTRQIEVFWYDNNWVKQSLDGLLTLTSINDFSINFGADITGTHTIFYKIY